MMYPRTLQAIPALLAALSAGLQQSAPEPLVNAFLDSIGEKKPTKWKKDGDTAAHVSLSYRSDSIFIKVNTKRSCVESYINRSAERIIWPTNIPATPEECLDVVQSFLSREPVYQVPSGATLEIQANSSRFGPATSKPEVSPESELHFYKYVPKIDGVVCTAGDLLIVGVNRYTKRIAHLTYSRGSKKLTSVPQSKEELESVAVMQGIALNETKFGLAWERCQTVNGTNRLTGFDPEVPCIVLTARFRKPDGTETVLRADTGAFLYRRVLANGIYRLEFKEPGT